MRKEDIRKLITLRDGLRKRAFGKKMVGKASEHIDMRERLKRAEGTMRSSTKTLEYDANLVQLCVLPAAVSKNAGNQGRSLVSKVESVRAYYTNVGSQDSL